MGYLCSCTPPPCLGSVHLRRLGGTPRLTRLRSQGHGAKDTESRTCLPLVAYSCLTSFHLCDPSNQHASVGTSSACFIKGACRVTRTLANWNASLPTAGWILAHRLECTWRCFQRSYSVCRYIASCIYAAVILRPRWVSAMSVCKAIRVVPALCSAGVPRGESRQAPYATSHGVRTQDPTRLACLCTAAMICSLPSSKGREAIANLR